MLILAKDKPAYVAFCDRMIEKFGNSSKIEDAERTVKACLLWPGAIDLRKLPVQTFTAPLDSGTSPDWYSPWGWSARSLLALRSNDAESALRYVEESERHSPNPTAHALNLSVAAMVQHRLGNADEARVAFEAATQAVNSLRENPATRTDHDCLNAQILLNEARTLIQGEE